MVVGMRERQEALGVDEELLVFLDEDFDPAGQRS